MALFGFGKKKNTEEELAQCDCGGMCKPSDIAAKKAAEEAEKAKSSGCCCGGNCNAETMAEAEKAKVSGSAVKESRLTRELTENGAQIFYRHAAANNRDQRRAGPVRYAGPFSRASKNH